MAFTCSFQSRQFDTVGCLNTNGYNFTLCFIFYTFRYWYQPFNKLNNFLLFENKLLNAIQQQNWCRGIHPIFGNGSDPIFSKAKVAKKVNFELLLQKTAKSRVSCNDPHLEGPTPFVSLNRKSLNSHSNVINANASVFLKN